MYKTTEKLIAISSSLCNSAGIYILMFVGHFSLEGIYSIKNLALYRLKIQQDCPDRDVFIWELKIGFALTTLQDWPKKLEQLFRPIRSKD